MAVNGIPKTERIWVKRITEKGETYYITSKDTRDYYFLYKMDGDKAVKLGKAKSPLELEQKYIGG
jgi:hypothetical protein